MDLAEFCTLRLALNEPVRFGPVAGGERTFARIREGRADGPGFAATVQPGTGDWLVTGEDGWAAVDVRLNLATADGAFLYVRWTGQVEINAKVKAAREARTDTAFADQRIRITPVMESGHPAYAWVNHAAFAGEGRFLRGGAAVGGGMEYRIHRLA